MILLVTAISVIPKYTTDALIMLMNTLYDERFRSWKHNRSWPYK